MLQELRRATARGVFGSIEVDPKVWVFGRTVEPQMGRSAGEYGLVAFGDRGGN